MKKITSVFVLLALCGAFVSLDAATLNKNKKKKGETATKDGQACEAKEGHTSCEAKEGKASEAKEAKTGEVKEDQATEKAAEPAK